jgi:hypothetical protein
MLAGFPPKRNELIYLNYKKKQVVAILKVVVVKSLKI